MTIERKLKLSGNMITLDTSGALFTVTRNCCVNGNCDYCTSKTKYGKPLRIVHTENVTLYQAELIADNWKSYDPEVIPCDFQ